MAQKRAGNDRKDRHVNVLLSKDEYALVGTAAKQDNRPVSAWARLALMEKAKEAVLA